MTATANPSPCHFLVLPAAGSGLRMGFDRPKQYLSLLGKPVLQHTLERLGSLQCFSHVVIVLAKGDLWWPELEATLPKTLRAKLVIAEGGSERCSSVLNGLQSLATIAQPDDWVLVHDVVRPCVKVADVERLLQQLRQHPVGGLLATPVRETLKRADANNVVEATVNREGLWAAATPQMFRFGLLQSALQKAASANRIVTDEAEAMEAAGHQVTLVQGGIDNLKLTYAEDMLLAARILAAGD